jgi:hypothetical protein
VIDPKTQWTLYFCGLGALGAWALQNLWFAMLGRCDAALVLSVIGWALALANVFCSERIAEEIVEGGDE